MFDQKLSNTSRNKDLGLNLQIRVVNRKRAIGGKARKAAHANYEPNEYKDGKMTGVKRVAKNEKRMTIGFKNCLFVLCWTNKNKHLTKHYYYKCFLLLGKFVDLLTCVIICVILWILKLNALILLI